MHGIGTRYHTTRCTALGHGIIPHDARHWDTVSYHMMHGIGTRYHTTRCTALGHSLSGSTQAILSNFPMSILSAVSYHTMHGIGTRYHTTRCTALGHGIMPHDARYWDTVSYHMMHGIG
eukprot:Polyplicarium_translucidae@DN2553_c0_g1_i6.p2